MAEKYTSHSAGMSPSWNDLILVSAVRGGDIAEDMPDAAGHSVRLMEPLACEELWQARRSPGNGGEERGPGIVPGRGFAQRGAHGRHARRRGSFTHPRLAADGVRHQ